MDAPNTSPSPQPQREWRLTQSHEFGKCLSVVTFDTPERFLIGTQVAALLKRETFNMYRSMKIKHVDIKRANPDQVDYLARIGAVKPGTHSVTLIPYEDGLYFIADAWYRQHRFELPYCTRKPRNRIRSFLTEKPKLHRRKPHPWNVHRALRTGDVGSDAASSYSSEHEATLAPAQAMAECTMKMEDHHLTVSSSYPLPDCPDALPRVSAPPRAPMSASSCQQPSANSVEDASRFFHMMQCS